MVKEDISKLVASVNDRFELWKRIVEHESLSVITEVGVFRGDFAAYLLKSCPNIQSYSMIDPWKNLEDWNKPANISSDIFNTYYNETMEKTAFAEEKRVVLRGKTTEMIHSIEDESQHMFYIDGDHTLRGITIDLISCWSKLKAGGIIAGDDFSASIWQHSAAYEPTLIFPFAVYFAEAMQVPIFALPYNQFLIVKSNEGYSFTDVTGGKYANLNLLHQFKQKPPSDKVPLTAKIKYKVNQILGRNR